MVLLIIGIAVVVLVGLYVIVTFNGLVRLRNRIENAWAQVDVQQADADFEADDTSRGPVSVDFGA